MGQTPSSDYDEFTNGNDAKFSEGWLINNSTSWDPTIRGEGRIGWAHTNEENDQIATNRTADIIVPDSMKSGFLIHLPWSNCRDFDILGILKSGQEVFIRRVNAYQNVRNNDTEGYHDGIAIVPIPGVDRFTHIRIRGVRGRIHYMGMGWSTSITASGADSGFVSARNIMGSSIAVGYNNPVPQDWTGANFARRDGRATHFDWKDDQKNYIRGDTMVDNNMFFGDNIVMSGDNSWILHSPDDGRKGLYIVPGRNAGNWEWDKVTSIESDGSINTSGLKVAKRDILSELDNLNSKIMSKSEILSFIKSNISAPPPPPPPILEGYKATFGYDAGGNDITNLDNASLASCKTDCDNRPDCKGFVFSSGSYPDKLGTCWIKNNVSNASPSGAWNLFEKNQ
jgi:hypothetical protein